MRNETRAALAAYTAGIAKANGVTSVENSFTVSPSVAQTLERKIQESSAFLSAINMMMVPEQTGQALKIAVGSPVSSRTNTATTALITNAVEKEPLCCTLKPVRIGATEPAR